MKKYGRQPGLSINLDVHIQHMYGKYKTKIANYVYSKETKLDETHTFKICDGMLQA